MLRLTMPLPCPRSPQQRCARARSECAGRALTVLPLPCCCQPPTVSRTGGGAPRLLARMQRRACRVVRRMGRGACSMGQPAAVCAATNNQAPGPGRGGREGRGREGGADTSSGTLAGQAQEKRDTHQRGRDGGSCLNARHRRAHAARHRLLLLLDRVCRHQRQAAGGQARQVHRLRARGLRCGRWRRRRRRREEDGEGRAAHRLAVHLDVQLQAMVGGLGGSDQGTGKHAAGSWDLCTRLLPSMHPSIPRSTPHLRQSCPAAAPPRTW